MRQAPARPVLPGSWSPSASPWPCSPRRCSPAAPAPRPRSLTVGSKNFSGRRSSQAYGQALEAKGYDISFKDNIGATEIVYPALENGDLDLYADYQGTLLTYLGGEPTGDSAANLQGAGGAAQGTDIVASRPAPAVDVNGFYVTKATAKKYKLKTMSDLKVVRPARRSAARPSARSGRSASVTPGSSSTASSSRTSRSSTPVARSRCRHSKTATSTSGSSSPAAA